MTTLNLVQKGCRRDSEIIRAVEKHKALNTEQIEVMFFSHLKTGQRLAQHRLKMLYTQRRLTRSRIELSQPCYYYIGKKPGQAEHVLAVNWGFVWVFKNLKKWEKIHCFYPEADYGLLRVDGLVGVKNTLSGSMQIFFIEADLSSNTFDKIAKYNDLYSSEKYLSAWWAPLVSRFPMILIFTATESRLRLIKEEIEKNNSNNLEFKTYLLPQVRRECLGRG